MKRWWLLLLVLLWVPLGAQAYDYTPDADVSYRTPYGEEVKNTLPGFGYLSPRADYRFHGQIDQAQRDAFIDAQERLLEELNLEGLTVFVLPDIQPWVDSRGRALFVPPAQDGGMTQAVAALQARYGEDAHYGLIFGAADALCRTVGLPGYTLRFNERGVLKFCNNQNNLAHFLLLYPSFTQPYTEPSLIPFVKDLAVRVYAFLREQGKAQELLSQQDAAAFQNAFVPLMNQYLQSIQAETGLHEHLPPLAFGTGGEDCPLILHAPHGTWYLYQDFLQGTPAWGDWGFPGLYQMAWQIEDELTHIDECLGLSPQRLAFRFRGREAYGSDSNFRHGLTPEGSLSLCTIDSLVHEYVHSRMDARFPGEEGWFLRELAATYFEMQGNYQAYDFMYMDIMGLTGEAAEYWKPVVDAWNANVLKMWTDNQEAFHYLCFARKQYDLTTPGSRTLNGIRSFACFLHEMYGDKKVGAALAQGDSRAALGKAWGELALDWQKHLESVYGQGSSL